MPRKREVENHVDGRRREADRAVDLGALILTIATGSGWLAIAPSVARVSTATGFPHRLLIILFQISSPMLRTGARISACVMGKDADIGPGTLARWPAI
jgi:hypothetical protein